MHDEPVYNGVIIPKPIPSGSMPRYHYIFSNDKILHIVTKLNNELRLYKYNKYNKKKENK